MPKRKHEEGRPGDWLHRVVAAVEQTLGNEQVSVESPKYLADRMTGEQREHDVVVTLRGSHHEVMIALECRDRSRPVGVPELEAFITKCSDTGVRAGVMVCPQGFWKTTLQKAEKYGVRCLTLEQAEAFPWLLAPGLHMIKYKVALRLVRPVVPASAPNEVPIGVVDQAGEALSPAFFIDQANAWAMSLEPDATDVGPRLVSFRLKTKGLAIKLSSSMQLQPVDQWLLTVELDRQIELKPFELLAYTDKRAEKRLSDVAVASVDLGKVKGSVVITRGKDGAVVSFVRQSNAKARVARSS